MACHFILPGVATASFQYSLRGLKTNKPKANPRLLRTGSKLVGSPSPSEAKRKEGGHNTNHELVGLDTQCE